MNRIIFILAIALSSSVVSAAPPVLGVSPTYMEFDANEGGANPEPQILSIWRDDGNEPLNWTVTEGCNWIVVDPNSGESTGEVDDCNVIIDISSLAGGLYSCQLTVDACSAANSPQIVDVNLTVVIGPNTVYGPNIDLSSKYFEFSAIEGGANPDDQILTITNTGDGILNWQIIEDCNWLMAVPNFGSSTGEADDVNFKVDIAGLDIGFYDCNVTVTGSNAINDPRVVLVTLTIGSGGNLYVPSDYPTIQAAIDAAVNGGVVIVADGTYTGEGNRDIDFRGKAIILRSENGPENCIIDCNANEYDEHRGFYFHTGEGPDSVIDGLTIINGYEHDGGGIYCPFSESNPTIANCIISGNTARYHGGGIYCNNSQPNIINCLIIRNSAKYGGGIFCGKGSPTIINCTVSQNEATFYNSGGGLHCSSGGNPVITNSIFWDNQPERIYLYKSHPIITYSDVQGGFGGEGNIDEDPCFASSTDYRLPPFSACIDAGTATPEGGLPATDIKGNERITDGNGDGTAVVDMGAYEMPPLQEPYIILAPMQFTFIATEGGPDASPQILSIRNLGVDPLNWQIIENCSWLQVSPASGSTTVETDSVSLSIDVTSLSPGRYSCEVKVSDGAASNSPVFVTVTLIFHAQGLLRVPSEFLTIQAAIDAAVDGDEVIVADGTYTGEGNRDIDFRGKAITLRSENGPENCIIDCNATHRHEHRGFYFHNGEDANSVMDGFTIIRGYADDGGGIFCAGSSPTINNCIISDNDGAGGGIFCEESSPTITNCMISDNDGYYCGGIFCYGGSPKITNCKVTQNKRRGGIYFSRVSNAAITNCTVSGNIGGGIRCYESTLIINNSIVWDNSHWDIRSSDGSVLSVTYSDIQGGWEGHGNIDADPLLTLDGHLSAGSPCIDAGDPNGDYSGQVDIDGEPRIAGTRVDMGVDEFLDTDVDGLPDWWEVKYFGSATGAEPNGDPDMDGFTNLVEYELYLSDPTIAAVTYYVNAEDGNDAYDGLAPEWDGQHGPKRTIQAGIDTAIVTDTVIVAMGRYVENINFEGKAIRVRSSNPRDWDVVENTIIDGNEGSRENGSCVVFNNGESSTSVLEGFTLTNGVGTDADYDEDRYRFGRYIRAAGGGIFCLRSSPTIRWCNIRANGPKVRYGGGIALLGNCRATISNCFIVDNEAMRYGGGIIIGSGKPLTTSSKITNCTIANNKAYDDLWWDCHDWPDCEHYARYQVDCYNTRPIISNTIIWSEDSPSSQRCLLIADPSLVRYSCVREAYILPSQACSDYYCLEDADPCDLTLFGGNISEWPRFVQPLEAYMQQTEYHLLADSPCIDAGDPNFVPGPDGTDIDGQPRVMAGRVDMGADEVVPEIIMTRPEGGEVWASGSTHEIQWSSYGAGEVDILLSKDAGGSWQSIKEGVSDTGSYSWHILNKYCSEEAQVKVVPSEPDANVICIESGVFAIVPYEGPVSVPRRKKGPRYKPVEKYGPEFGCVKWKFETEGPVTAGVTIGREIDKQRKVYAACEDGKLYALDLETGSLLWSYDVNSALVGSAAEGLQGCVYVGGRDGRLYAIDKEGGLLWTHSTDAPIYSSAVVSPQEQIYVCSEDGMLYALRRNGSEVWRYETSGFAKLDGSIFATLQIGSDGTVYIAGLYDPNLYALNPKDGSVKWRCNFAPPHDPCAPGSGGRRSGWPFAPPAVAPDGTIYQTLLYDPNLYAVEPETGTIIWSTDLAGTLMWYKNFIEYPDLYTKEIFIWYGSGDPPEYIEGHELYLIGRHKHAPSWTSPALGPDGTIYVSFDDPYLRAVDPDGEVKWATRLGMVGGLTVTVGDDGLVYAASTDNKLYVVEPTGEEVARFKGDGWLSHPVIAPGHTIIVSDANNTVWAITQEDCGDEPIVLDVPPEP